MTTSIFDTLERLQLTSKDTRYLYNTGTRDINELPVWRDKFSGVIYIDEFYTGDDTYIDGTYRDDQDFICKTGTPDYERHIDALQRFNRNLQFVSGKRVADFGCGAGDFLRLVQSHAENVCGIELQKCYIEALRDNGIDCVNSLDAIDNKSIDTFVSFHAIEHLPNPLEILTSIKQKLDKNGTLILEVPNANDFLLIHAKNEYFKNFTLWSQHLVLHTRESLRRMLQYVGFENILIKGIQRYPLSNHMHWLVNGTPGGHKSVLSLLDTPSLCEAYSESLANIDATDTLVAIAQTG